MKTWGRFVSFLIHSNLFIGLAAAGLAFQTRIEFGFQPAFKPYLLLLFFATLFDYNLHRLNTFVFHKEALQDPKHRWLRENVNLFLILCAISFIGFAITLVFAKTEVLYALLPFALITVFYSFPFFVRKGKQYRLRDIPYFKNTLIALVWAGSSTLLPYVESETPIALHALASLFAFRFLLIFAVSIPFDLRDAESDKKQGLKTIAHLGTESSGIRIAALALILMALSASAYHVWMQQVHLALAYLFSAWAGISILRSERLKSQSIYHYGFVDGMIVLQTILIFLAHILRNLF